MQTVPLPQGSSIKSVLVWDPEARHRSGLIRELSDEYRVFVASDLSQAEQFVVQNNIDLALIDVDLPRKSSVSLLKSLHRRQPQTKVIMMTDYGDDELWVDMVNEGASDLLCRPVHRDDVERAI